MEQPIQLEQLNVDLRQKLGKFDTSNDGTLSNKELVQAVVTLQKQSDNYKKTLWVLVPIILFTLAAVFATTILAIKLTKDTYSSNGQLVDNNGNVLETGKSKIYDSLADWISNNDFSFFDKLELPNGGFFRINNVFFSNDTNTKYMDTDLFTLMYFQSNSSFSIYTKKDYLNDVVYQDMINQVQLFTSTLNDDLLFTNFQNKISNQASQIKARPFGGSSVKCNAAGVCRR
jgi:hypothetical protein